MPLDHDRVAEPRCPIATEQLRHECLVDPEVGRRFALREPAPLDPVPELFPSRFHAENVGQNVKCVKHENRESRDNLSSDFVVEVYTPPMRANLLLKHNIDALLRARGQTRKDLAMWCHRTESWISKIFLNANREIPLKYLDRIADFFGLATYQLFAPGISPLTERRKGHERRNGKDRRIGQRGRELQIVANEMSRLRRDALTATETRWLEQIRTLDPSAREHLDHFLQMVELPAVKTSKRASTKRQGGV